MLPQRKLVKSLVETATGEVSVNIFSYGGCRLNEDLRSLCKFVDLDNVNEHQSWSTNDQNIQSAIALVIFSPNASFMLKE